MKDFLNKHNTTLKILPTSSKGSEIASTLSERMGELRTGTCEDLIACHARD
jgi:hypothetical protein